MAHKTAPCQNCHAEYTLWPKNRKYCGTCQALRDLDFRPGMSRNCEMCDVRFYPFRTGYTRCYECSNFRPVRPDEYPVCGVCEKAKRTAPGLANTCVSCVQRDSASQSIYHKKLRAIVRERQKETA
jgi:hypothetical protein